MRKFTRFTSEVITELPEDLEDEILEEFEISCDEAENLWSIFNEESECRRNSKSWQCYPFGFWEELISYVEMYNIISPYDYKDYTCFVKGYVLGRVLDKILDEPSKFKFLVNFGGDMIVRKFDAVGLKGASNSDVVFFSDFPYCYGLFTSGNTDKRGKHIKGLDRWGTTTIIVEEPKPRDMASLDALCTILFSGAISRAEACEIAKSHGYDLMVHENYKQL